MRTLAALVVIVSVSVCSLVPPCSAADHGWDSAGIRYGIPNKNTITIVELFALYKLPWELRSASGWGVSPEIDLAAGGVVGKGDIAFIGSTGPTFIFGKTGFPLEAAIGIDAAFLSRDTFGNRDYNGIVQFMSYGGLNYRIAHRVDLMYRFQHMSNAGINGRRNPGVNHHVFGIAWHFGRTP